MFNKARSWFTGLSKAGKIGVALASVTVLGVAASPRDTKPPAMPPPAAIAPAPEKKAAVTEKKIVTETEPVPFEKKTTEDGNLEKGKTALKVTGVNGIKTLTYEITLTDGIETKRTLIKQDVSTAPISELVLVGTKIPPLIPTPAAAPTASCHPSYTGACVPIASDVDCAGGSGNGPAYVSGPVTIVGSDVYDLDRDSDGLGCE